VRYKLPVTPSLDTVLFDLDGTLLDSMALIVASYTHVQQVHPELPPRDRAAIMAHVGKTLTATFEEWSGGASAEAVETMVQTYIRHNLEVHDQWVRPCKGMPELVEVLSGAGVPLAVVTSKRRKATLMGLRFLGLLEPARFGVLVCGDDVTRGKPHPEAVELALTQLEADPARTVFVGDSSHDLEAGKAAGVTTVGVTWGSAPRDALERADADAVVDTAAELTAFLRARGLP